LLNKEKQNNDKLIDYDITSQEMPRNWRRRTERHLEIYIERYLNFEHDIELKSPVILLFLENHK